MRDESIIERHKLEIAILESAEKIERTHSLRVKDLLRDFYRLQEQYRTEYGLTFDVAKARAKS